MVPAGLQRLRDRDEGHRLRWAALNKVFSSALTGSFTRFRGTSWLPGLCRGCGVAGEIREYTFTPDAIRQYGFGVPRTFNVEAQAYAQSLTLTLTCIDTRFGDM